MEDYMEDLKDVVEEPNQINPSEEINSEEEIKKTKEATAMVEYKEVDEPCVALTIIGENRLTDAEVFVRRGFRFSLKAFFSTIVLTIMNMFIEAFFQSNYKHIHIFLFYIFHVIYHVLILDIILFLHLSFLCFEIYDKLLLLLFPFHQLDLHLQI